VTQYGHDADSFAVHRIQRPVIQSSIMNTPFRIFSCTLLGAMMAGLAACSSTASGLTYTINPVRVAGLQQPAFTVECHGIMGSAQSCMKAAEDACEGKRVMPVETVDGLHSHVAANDPRKLTFICVTPAAQQPAPTAQPQPQPQPQAQPVQPAPQPAPAPTRQVLLQGDANFAVGSAVLTAQATEQLDAFVRTNQGVNFRQIVVTGYTDSTGSAQRNVELSRERAAATVGYLERHGIHAGMMVAEGHGAADPVATNATKEGRERNRRVEVRVSTK
jgi:outer membrane protein OmpA-like peptidoglycan-associated protein